jgi:anti-sigma regulatory factor (Ser/Thr protein kinase)
MKTKKIKLTIPNDISYLPIILDSVNKMACMHGFSKGEISKIEIGTEEAVSNVIDHAFDATEDASFDVIIEQQKLGLKVIIKEMGIPFDPSLIPEYDINNLQVSVKGLGTHLMKAVIDDVSFLNLGKAGKETHLFKHLNTGKIEDLMSKEELDDAEKAKTDEPLPKGSVKYKVRRMYPDEAVDVCKGAYSSYGYSYVLEHIYYPDRVREMNDSDELISFVAVTEDAPTVIAHSALEIEEMDRMVPQLGVAFTMPKYRGQGCMGVLGDAVMQEAADRNYTGVYARGITTHPYSQKACLKMGLMDCALLLSSGPEREYKGFEGKPQRESVVYHFKYMNKPESFEIFPPKKHAEIIEKIYANVGFSPKYGSPESIIPVSVDGKPALLNHEATIEIMPEANNSVGKIRISEYGSNVLHEVQKSLQSLCMDRIDTIYLFLRLNDPYTAYMTEEFEKMGFFFSGVMPGSENRDALVLQYLNNHQLDYDRIQLAGDMSKKIMEYIKEITS